MTLFGLGAATTVHNNMSVTSADDSSSTETSDDHPVCGQWCASHSIDKTTKCRMDQSIMPCRDPWCTTTCDLWNLFVLGDDDKRRPVSCALYASGMGYPRGAQVCNEDCLIPEIRKERYPAPAGYGIMCRPGTCAPAATPLKNVGKALGELQCPCNWFGSECTDNWIPVERVEKGEPIGLLEFVTLKLDVKSWKEVLEDYRPGGVVRIVHLDPNTNIPQEMACALAGGFETPGELTFLMAPPDQSLRPEPRQVADRIRAMPPNKSKPVSNLYVNPSISGFFNGNYDYLMDYIRKKQGTPIRRMIILSSGAGLGGALSAVDAVVRENSANNKETGKPPIEIYLYYGLRNLEHLPYRERLEQLVASGDIRLTLVVSGCPDISAQLKHAPSPEIEQAVQRGETSGKLLPIDSMKEFLSKQGSRPYTQHVVGLDLSSQEGLLQSASFEETIFITCGRVEMLHDTGAILRALSGNSELVSEHIFTNI